jgi:hypothetical protein
LHAAFGFGIRPALNFIPTAMFSHIVIFWTDPENPKATDDLLAGAEKYLKPIPLCRHYHCGRMATSERKDVVDQSYQVALNLVFDTKADQDAYQVHPLHLQFVENCKANWKRVVVYDFE